MSQCVCLCVCPKMCVFEESKYEIFKRQVVMACNTVSILILMHLYMYLSYIPTQNKIIPVNDKFCEGVEGRN